MVLWQAMAFQEDFKKASFILRSSLHVRLISFVQILQKRRKTMKNKPVAHELVGFPIFILKCLGTMREGKSYHKTTVV